MKITWKGNAFFEVKSAGKIFFIDPWIKTNPGCPIDFCDLKAGYPDYVFVTHGHPGHWGRGDSVVVSRLSDAPYYAPENLINYLDEHGYLSGVQPRSMVLGERINVNDSLAAWLFESIHPTVPHIDPKWGHFPGEPNGLFAFQEEGKTLVHVGDALMCPVFDKLHDLFPKIDVLTFPLWGQGMGGTLDGVMDIVAQVIDILKPDHVFLHNRMDPDMPSWKVAKDRLPKMCNSRFELLEQKIDVSVEI